jgi:hypothetical protein
MLFTRLASSRSRTCFGRAGSNLGSILREPSNFVSPKPVKTLWLPKYRSAVEAPSPHGRLSRVGRPRYGVIVAAIDGEGDGYDFGFDRCFDYCRHRRNLLLGHRQVCQRPPTIESAQIARGAHLPRCHFATSATVDGNVLMNAIRRLVEIGLRVKAK